MAVNRGWGVRQNGTGETAVGTTAKEFRLSLAGLLAETSPGVPRSGLLDPVSATVVSGTGSWTYNVLACNPVIHRTAGEGVYMPTFTGLTPIGTSAAPGTGFRYDLIWVNQNDVDKGDPDNLAYVGVTQGAASGSPSKPYGTVPDGALVLAEALVGAGATATNHALVTITQVFPYTTVRGAPIPVRSSAERDLITATTGLQVKRLDLADLIETYQAGSWTNGRAAIIPSGNLFAGWTRIASTGAAAPKVWSPDGVTVHIGGGVKFNAGAGAEILTVPAAFASAETGIHYLTATLASNGAVDPVNGAVIELLMENNIIRIGYQTKSVAVGSFIGLHGSWNRRAAV
jgi:hypothetical protein